MRELRCAARLRPALLPGVRRAPDAAQRLPARGRARRGGSRRISPSTPPAPPQAATDPSASRNATLTALAGIGLLLLAMGVGVLIGRSGSSKQAAPAAQVITVAGTGSSSSTGGGEATFTSDWPSGTSGYTVQLETLPQSGTSVSAVESAKTSATGKGASAVGALKSEEFSASPQVAT